MKNDIVVAINNILTSKKGAKYATLQEIYDEVAKIRNCEVDNALETQVRARLQEHSSQYKQYNGKEDLFETQEFNSGLWRNKITGEREIRDYVFKLVGEFPGIDVTSMQKVLLELLEDKLTEADKLESKTRPGEMKIEQIFRNFVSHKDSYKDKIDFVSDGGITRMYLKDINAREKDGTLEFDTQNDAIVIKQIEKVIEEENETPKNIDDVTLNMLEGIPVVRKRKQSSERVYVRKSDFESYINDYKKKLDNGYMGEALVFEYEKNRLTDLGREDLAEKVKWISRDDGDGYGYDIKSFDITENGDKEIFIEVKSTSSSINSDFEMSKNEMDFAKSHKDNYKIYRIYKNGSKTSGYIIDSSIEDHFDIIPTTFKVSIKSDE